jgi:hypothetical protein
LGITKTFAGSFRLDWRKVEGGSGKQFRAWAAQEAAEAAEVSTGVNKPATTGKGVAHLAFFKSFGRAVEVLSFLHLGTVLTRSGTIVDLFIHKSRQT